MAGAEHPPQRRERLVDQLLGGVDLARGLQVQREVAGRGQGLRVFLAADQAQADEGALGQ